MPSALAGEFNDCRLTRDRAAACLVKHCMFTRKGTSISSADCLKQVEGDIRVNEWSNIDPDLYQYEVSVAGKDSGTDAGANLKAAVQGLQGSVLGRLQQYVTDLNGL